MTSQPIRPSVPRWRLAIAVILVFGLTGFTSVWTNALGAADRLDRLVARVELFLDPPPDRATLPTVVVTPEPSASPTLEPTPVAVARGEEHVGAGEIVERPRTTPTPAPVRAPVDVDLVAGRHQEVFISQQTTEWCAVAGTQMVLAILGLADSSPEFQHELAGRIGEWDSWEDSHDGGWGPGAVGLALAAYGAADYEIRAYGSYTDALRDSAVAISTLEKPVVMFPWWGAHTWVMTGYQADADPTIFPDATITGAYILDPWYPRFSSIWGQSDAPGNFEDLNELARNWPAFQSPPGFEHIGTGWTRPEGAYPNRDGMFIVLMPTTPREG